MNTTFVCKMAVSALLCAAFLPASATEYTFPSAGGDLASDAAWGETRPTSADSIKIDKAGTYTLSDDVTFSEMYMMAGGSTFSLGNRKMTLTTSAGDTRGFRVEGTASSRNVFAGGIYDLSGTAHCLPAYNANNVNTVFTNNCVVTNVVKFFAARYSSNSKTEIAGGAKVYADELRAHNNSGANNTLEIYDGGQLHVANRIYSEASDGNGGGQRIEIRGAGSILRQAGTYAAMIGYKGSACSLLAVDGGEFSSENGGITLGSANASGVVTSFGNSLLVENGGTAKLKTVGYKSYGNTISVSNATFTCTSTFRLSDTLAASNNLFRAYGPDTVLSLPIGELFGSNTNMCNAISLEGGLKWDLGGRDSNVMMARTHNSIFRITGVGTTIGNIAKNFYIGDKDSYLTIDSVSNRLEVLDGATLNACRVPIMGVANTLCISNATVNVGDDSVGLRVGYRFGASPATNCVLVMQGETPRIDIAASSDRSSSCVFDNGSTLRFEIPKKGYAKGYVPFTTTCAFKFNSDACKLEIDCEDFVACTGGRLHLIHAYNIPSPTQTLLRKCSLPEGCTLEVTTTDVYIKSKSHKGMVVSIF